MCARSQLALLMWGWSVGLSPAWLLQYVLVKDLQTGSSYYFLVEEWLSVDNDRTEGQVELKVEATGERGGIFPLCSYYLRVSQLVGFDPEVGGGTFLFGSRFCGLFVSTFKRERRLLKFKYIYFYRENVGLLPCRTQFSSANPPPTQQLPFSPQRRRGSFSCRGF